MCQVESLRRESTWQMKVVVKRPVGPSQVGRAWKRGIGEMFIIQSCLTIFCDPMDHDLPGSSVHGIFQARILEWVAISFSKER